MNLRFRISARWRLAARWAVVGSVAAAVTVTGLPAVETASAAPKAVSAKIRPGAKRCDERNLGKLYSRTPVNSGFPSGPTNRDTWKGNPKNYNYDLWGKAFDGVKAPSAAQKSKAASKVPGDTKKNYEAWRKQADASKDPDDRVMELYARYLHNKEGLSWDHWFEHRFIRNQTNNHKGGAFETRMVKDFRLVGPDWLCEVWVDLFDENGNRIESRRYDAYNRAKGEFNEFKSNGKLDNKQLAKDRKIARLMPDKTLRYSGAKNFSAADIKKIDNLNRYVGRIRGGKPNQVRGFTRQYNAVPQTRPIRGYSRFDRWFAPGCHRGGGPHTMLAAAPSCGTRGPVNDRINGSGRTPQEARRIQAEARRFDSRGTLPRGGPGGVDFTTLELRYVGGLEKGKGMQYSMKADQAPDPENNPGHGGRASMQLASDALFTWLALTPEKFWVNLNPDQPEKIMDSDFASTDAGRVLLEADLAMKFDFAEAINPEKHPGAKRFWDTAPRRDGMPCFPEVRLWIEPERAKVREQNGGIYILDAPLKVSTEWMDMDWSAPGARECRLTEPEKRASEANLRANVMPEVERRVNSGPTYADLRRVYTSRVAAEYIRQQDARKATDFRGIIDSGDVSAWPLRAPHEEWTKQSTYDRYMKSLREGVEWFELEYGGKVYNQGVGGVDFQKSPKRNISKARFDVENRDLDNTTRNSMKSDDTSYRDTETLYLGGGSGTGADGGGDGGDGGGDGDGGDDGGTPTPGPSPTDPDDPQPTDPPSSPAPSPSAPGGGSDDRPAPPGKDPEGDLAGTGAGIPVGLLAAVAAVLTAAGGAVLWWRRRKDSTG